MRNGSRFEDRTVLNWRQLLHCSDGDLARLDIARVNLACAVGLPGCQTIDEPFCLDFLDRCAERVAQQMPGAQAAFQKQPEHWDNSWGICRIHLLYYVLSGEFGVRYNPAKTGENAVFLPEDTFIHGAIQRDGGTCSSLPVIYAAVGRRLGWPLKLVHACAKRKIAHRFCRWDEPGGERFNVEITNDTGLNCHPDDHYRTGVYDISPDIEEAA
jgi:hypothetical protein